MSTIGWGIWLVGAYLLGSVPFGLLIGLAKGVDIRKSGSGNVGATNAGRVLGRRWGLLCFLLDVFKGLGPTLGYGLWAGLAAVSPRIPVRVAGPRGLEIYESDAELITLAWMAVAVAAVLGHVFPIWLKFKGGKGVATGLGVMLGFWPVLTLPGVAVGLIWVALVKVTGYVSLASVAASAALPLIAVISGICWKREPGEIAVYAGVCAVLAVLIAVRHRGNITRLRAGTEPKAGWAKKDQA